MKLDEIARLAGVSRTTASYVINGKAKQYRVSDKTVEKVMAVVREHNYHPNAVAAGLRAGRTRSIGLVIPALNGRLKGHAQRVPVKTGSVTELVAILGKKVTVEEINAALKKATQGNKSFGYTDDEIVSSDVIGSHYGSVFDATQTEVSEAGDLQLVKAVAWYDNEYGFVTQLVRTLDKFAAL